MFAVSRVPLETDTEFTIMSAPKETVVLPERKLVPAIWTLRVCSLVAAFGNELVTVGIGLETETLPTGLLQRESDDLALTQIVSVPFHPETLAWTFTIPVPKLPPTGIMGIP